MEINSITYWRCLAVDGAGYLYAGSWEGLVFRSDISTLRTFPPSEYALSQNFPNPFNSRTQIDYDIPASGYVTLKVFDSLGREVKTLVDGQVSPGYHSIEMDSKGLPSGVYFYRLSTHGNVMTRKMIFLK
jgi:hypothetical protein